MLPEAAPDEDHELVGGPDEEDPAAEAEARVVDNHYGRIVSSRLHWGSSTMSSGLSALTALPLVVIHFPPAQVTVLRKRMEMLKEHLEHLNFDFDGLGVPMPDFKRVLAEFLVLRQRQGRAKCWRTQGGCAAAVPGRRAAGGGPRAWLTSRISK